ncbi:amidohydrolase family protein [Achromobacter kerstersii]|jgi:allantoinase|uniref:amidohydrolase family protein n=1 Tax=Achromobacter kerstersii TaxID=1353890 RepID=UPI00320A59D9
MSDFDMVIRGSLVGADSILEDGWLGVVDGKIAAMGSHSPPAARDYVDARGLWVLPGAIDSRTYIGGWGDGEGIGRASREAAAGGVTTLVDMPYEHAEVVASRSQLDAMVSRIEQGAQVDVAVAGTLNAEHGLRATKALADGGICAFSIPTFEVERSRFAHHESDLIKAFQAIARFGLACSMHNHARLTAGRNARQLLDAGKPGKEVLARANLALIEGLTTRLLCRVGAAAGVRMQAADVWSEQGHALCAHTRKAGHWVMIETCLRSLMLCTEDAVALLGGSAQDYPLLRSRQEVEALWRRLANDACTFVSTGYHARVDDTLQGPGRTPDYGPKLLLPTLWTGCEARGLSPTLVVRLLCLNPAVHFLLDDRKGSFDIGKDADFVVLAPGPSPVQPLASIGRPHSVHVYGTWRRGELVYDGRRVQAAPGTGRFLRARTPVAHEERSAKAA